MKSRIIGLLLVFNSIFLFAGGVKELDIHGDAGQYEANWNSLDQRVAPQWYGDAKFGIFIHWGIYSVPAAAPIGAYAEWYWKHLMRGFTWYHFKGEGDPIHIYHRKKYGKDFKYEDFEKGFTAEKFDPTKWAKLFSDSGAKYIAITSKHHEGFCLWPNKEANEMRGRAWNSFDGTAKRDILRELSDAVRKTDVRFGVYYSLKEWANPTWTWNKRKYIDEYMIPQFQEMVSRYHPDLIFSDGEWDLISQTWRSEEIVAWLFNNFDDIVVNDRWGMFTRHKHGTYYTTEYGSGLDNDSHLWEENRGIGWSYGYNQFEKPSDYRSTQELLLMLVDIVSRGGNFLLNIGPKADGSIPQIMQDRLHEMGKWLDVNGEAIYGTRMWNQACQWSKGIIHKECRLNFGGGYNILEQTISPPKGAAIKELFFTKKGDTLYLTVPVRPKTGFLSVNNLDFSVQSATLLGGNALQFKEDQDHLSIDLSALRESDFNLPIVIALKP